MTFADLTPHMLLSAILYVTVCPNGELFNRMSLHTLCDEDITVEHFMERFNACAPGASSPIPVHLATGMRGTLNRFPGNSAAEQASQYASWLSNKREEVWQAIHDIVCVPPASGGINYDHLLLVLAKDFMVPKLRAVMLLRFLHCLCPESYDLDRFDAGEGAIAGLRHIGNGRIPKTGLPAFQELIVSAMREHMTESDEHGVLQILGTVGINLLQNHNMEHLMCEGRKATSSGRIGGGPRTNQDEYINMFIQVQQLYLKPAPGGGIVVCELGFSRLGVVPASGGVASKCMPVSRRVPTLPAWAGRLHASASKEVREQFLAARQRHSQVRNRLRYLSKLQEQQASHFDAHEVSELEAESLLSRGRALQARAVISQCADVERNVVSNQSSILNSGLVQPTLRSASVLGELREDMEQPVFFA